MSLRSKNAKEGSLDIFCLFDVSFFFICSASILKVFYFSILDNQRSQSECW